MTATDLPLDPWANRSEGMRCRTCLWFVPKGVMTFLTLAAAAATPPP